MKLAALAIAVPALLAAASADAKPKVYRAVGTEPFWTLDIGAGSIVYKRIGGATIVTRTPPARATANGRRYVTPRIAIDITRERCNDGMGNRTYPEAVKVTIGGSVVMGCGGDPLIDENLLQETSWTIVSIDGRPVQTASPTRAEFADGRPWQTARPTRISFADGQLSGYAGCNRINGSYVVRGGALVAGRVVSTRMACLGPGMQIERRFLTIIATPATLSLIDDNTISLKSSGGSVVLRQARE